MSDLYTRFDSVFFERTRLSILTLVSQTGRASFNQLRDLLEVSDGALYTHLEKLIGGGYLEKQRTLVGSSPQTVYTLTANGQSEYVEYLRFLESVVGAHRSGRSAEGENSGDS